MKARGFTLVSLMIVVAIIGILAVIAVPSYSQYVKNARRTEAINALQTLAYREEGYFSRFNEYTTDMTKLGYGSQTGVDTKQRNYSVTVTAADAASFEAEAVPQSGQASDACGTFTIDSLGQKGASGTGCWP